MGVSTLDLFGAEFVLLRFEPSIDIAPLRAAPAERRLPLRIVDIKHPNVASLYERKLVLLRPDGHVAWRDDALKAAPPALLDRVRSAAWERTAVS